MASPAGFAAAAGTQFYRRSILPASQGGIGCGDGAARHRRSRPGNTSLAHVHADCPIGRQGPGAVCAFTPPSTRRCPFFPARGIHSWSAGGNSGALPYTHDEPAQSEQLSKASHLERVHRETVASPHERGAWEFEKRR